MNVFVFCFLTTAVVTAAPHAPRAPAKHQHKSENYSTSNVCHQEPNTSKIQLRDIMNDVKNLKKILSKKILRKAVQYVFNNEECSCEMLCKAGSVLSAFDHSELGLSDQRNWRLPRRLKVYTQMQNCSSLSKLDSVPLDQLLDKIHSCAQKEHTHI